jgi:hypothetical protein
MDKIIKVWKQEGIRYILVEIDGYQEAYMSVDNTMRLLEDIRSSLIESYIAISKKKTND